MYTRVNAKIRKQAIRALDMMAGTVTARREYDIALWTITGLTDAWHLAIVAIDEVQSTTGQDAWGNDKEKAAPAFAEAAGLLRDGWYRGDDVVDLITGRTVSR